MNSDSQILDGLIGVEGIACQLKCTSRTIYRYINEPDGLPFIRIGGRTYFSIEKVNAWIKSRQSQRNPRRAPRSQSAKHMAA